MVKKERFTEEQILEGIQYALQEIEPPRNNAKFDGDTQLSQFFTEHMAGLDVCPLQILECVAEYFGFEWGQSRWLVWLKYQRVVDEKSQEEWLREVSPTITFGRLARTIAKHAPFIPIQPVTVFGVSCEKAGVFKGLCQLPQANAKRIAPSTRLDKVVSPWSANEFLRRARWVCQADISDAPRYWSLLKFNPWDLAAANLAFYLTSSFCMAIAVAQTDSFNGWIYAWALIAFIMGILAKNFVLRQISNPWPDGISTFGDLSRSIVKQRLLMDISKN